MGSRPSPAAAGLLACLVVLAAAPPPALSAEAVSLAAHRAFYTLTAGTVRSNDVAGVSGKMAYEVTDACDGWAVRQRLEMTITHREGQDIQMVSDYTTYEAKDGSQLHYRMRQTTDTAVTSEVAGDASLDRPGVGSGSAHYTVPEDATKALPGGTLFPMAHTSAIIAAAEAGKKILALPLFDGTGIEGAQDTSIAIVGWNPAAETRWPVLTALPSGRVHVAFFDRSAGAQQPEYEVGMRYWANGVADDLEMDFGDFVMNGKLVDLQPQKPAC